MAITQFRGAGITMDDPLGQFGSVDVTCDVCGYAQSYYTPAATQAAAEQLLQKLGWTFGRLVCCPPTRDASTNVQEMFPEHDRLLAMIADGLVSWDEFRSWMD
jgi:hypothetical protein